MRKKKINEVVSAVTPEFSSKQFYFPYILSNFMHSYLFLLRHRGTLKVLTQYLKCL